MAFEIGPGITFGPGITIQLPAAGGGGGGGTTTYNNSATTFLGNGDAPPWVVTSVYNGGSLFKIATASTPSSAFISAINALTIGSQITIVDSIEGTVNVTLTTAFGGTFTTNGNEEYAAGCISTVGFLYSVTSMAFTVATAPASNIFNVGDSKTISITTSSGAADTLTVVTSGQQNALTSWSSAALSRTGGSATVTFDMLNDASDNGDGTWTYSIYITNYPGAYSWTGMTLDTSSSVSIAPTYTAAPWITNYSTGPYKLDLWYASTSDAQYVAAIAATSGKVVAFYISGTEYRGVVSSVSISNNSIYGPTAYVVSFTFSGAASGYTLPSSGTPDNSPVSLISN